MPPLRKLMHLKNWNKEDTATLIKRWNDDPLHVAEDLGRTLEAIYNKKSRLRKNGLASKEEI